MAQNGGMGHAPHDSGLSVGSSTKEEDIARIRDLEEEVRYLADRANQASQKFADYENDIRTLEAKLRQEQRKNAAAAAAGGGGEGAPPPPPEKPQLSRFGSLMRKPSPSQTNGAVQAPGAREKELEAKVVQEQTARIAAEKKVKAINAEMEDFSTNLLQEANQMVAAERRENAELAEKVKVLEKKQDESAQTAKAKEKEDVRKSKVDAENRRLKAKIEVLEKREVERKRRLERLEQANERIARVRVMLKPG